MALNLHQARGEWKRKSWEEMQPASRYTLNPQPHNAGGSDSSSRTHVEPGDETHRRLPGLQAPAKPSMPISFLSFLSFHFKCITFQPLFPFCATLYNAKPWLEHAVPAQDTFQPLNSISRLTATGVSSLIISSAPERLRSSNKVQMWCWLYLCVFVCLVLYLIQPLHRLKIHIYEAPGAVKCPGGAMQHIKHRQKLVNKKIQQQPSSVSRCPALIIFLLLACSLSIFLCFFPPMLLSLHNKPKSGLTIPRNLRADLGLCCKMNNDGPDMLR